MASTETRPASAESPRKTVAPIDGLDPLVAPAAVRVIDLGQPLHDLALRRWGNRKPYRSLLAVARLDGDPLATATFAVGPGGHVSRTRLVCGLTRQIVSELREANRELASVPWPAPAAPRGAVSDRRRCMWPPVSVVVPTCGNPRTLARCVRSILACDYDEFEVIVVENRPDRSNTERMLARRFRGEARLRYVAEFRRGASWARNAGLTASEGEVIAFADDDVLVDRRWLRAGVDALMRADDIACVTGLILPLELDSDCQLLLEQFAGFGKGFRRRTYRFPDAREQNPLFPYTVGAIGSGASTVLRAAVAHELHGFDITLGPGTPTTGAEDLDLLIRVLRSGRAVAYEPGAIVWHRHPDGAAQLRRHAYRYGIGLGAMLAKQMIAGPERSYLLRAVPAGVRYLRDPGSRKNVSRPADFPRHLAWLERLGMLVGPAAYVLSVLLARVRHPARKGRSVQAVRSRTATPVLPCVATMLSVAASLSTALGVPAGLRMPAVLGFLCLAPGTAFVTAVRGRHEPALVVGVSIGIVTILAAAMLWLGAWWPRLFVCLLAAACVLLLVPSIQGLGAELPDSARMRDLLARVSRVVRSIPRTASLHAMLLLGSLLAWRAALAGTDLTQIGGIGLLDAFPSTYFVAFALLLVGFAIAVTSDPARPWLLAAYVLSLIVLLHTTTALLYDEPRYPWTYKHIGVINLIAATGHADREIDIYNNWPAFFAANAWLSKTAGSAPLAYAGWAQLFFNLVDAVAVRFALRGLTGDQRLLWTATFLFVLGNWVGQDYLAPQALGFALSLVILGLCLRCGPVAARRRSTDQVPPPPLGSRAAVLAGTICFLAVVMSHQLSPLMVILSVVALALATRRVPLWVPVVMIAIEAWWLSLAWPFIGRHFALIAPGGAGAGAPDRNLSAALPGAALSFYAPAAVMLVMGTFALAGAICRLRAGNRDVVPACLIGAPILAVAFQSYDGEGPYRAYLFGLPWLAFLAAFAFARSPSPAVHLRMHLGRLIAATAVVGVCLLFAYFGQELINRIPTDDVQAATWYEEHAPQGAIRIRLAPTAPDRLTSRYPLVSLSDPRALLERRAFTRHRPGAADIPNLEAVINAQRAHPTYVILSSAQENYALLNGLLPKGSVLSLTRALEKTRGFQLVFRRPTAWIFQVTTSGTGARAEHPERQRHL